MLVSLFFSEHSVLYAPQSVEGINGGDVTFPSTVIGNASSDFLLKHVSHY